MLKHKNRLIDKDDRMIVTGRYGGGGKEGNGGQTQSDGRRLDFGWGAYNVVFRCRTDVVL